MITGNDHSIYEDAILTDMSSKSNKKIAYIKVRGWSFKYKNLASLIMNSIGGARRRIPNSLRRLFRVFSYIVLFLDVQTTVGIRITDISSWNVLQYLNSLIQDIFLPKGYPNSVSSDYLEYQIWDTCQAFCSSISGTLTMRAVMQGIGVGSEAATPVSAAITWIMKDGTGMVGSILFAWLKGSKLDSDCKKWRLFADILNDIAMFIELYIPFVIDYSMYMLCIATTFKALVGTAGSSTRAALITHQAIKGNIADVSAKDGSQEIFTNLFAFIFGVFLLKNVTETDQIWTLMCTATLFHLIFNYKAVRCLKINVFNSERFCLSLRTYLPTSNVPTVEQINKRESVFLITGISDSLICGFSIKFGVCMKKAIRNQNVSAFYLSTLTSLFQDKNYFMIPHTKKHQLYVTFRQNFNEVDVLKAYFHASLLAIALTYLQGKKTLHVISRSRKNSPIYRLKNLLQEIISSSSNTKLEDNPNAIALQAFMTCEDFVDKEFAAFYKACDEQGWKVNKHLINIDDWRADWTNGKDKRAPRKSTVRFNTLPPSTKPRTPSHRPRVQPSSIDRNFLIIS